MSILERIALRDADLGDGLIVRRALPTRQRRMIGAWCFLDHIGPVDFAPGAGLHVGAHPHIGLQTFTWMIEGELLHRDSLGSERLIRPGQVNLMTAGRGVVHTEDTPAGNARLHAAQLWIALPPELADMPPAFAHYAEVPVREEGGVRLALLAGRYGELNAPASVHSPLQGFELAGTQGGTIAMTLEPGFEYGLLPLSGRMRLGDDVLNDGEFVYLGSGNTALSLTLAAGASALLLGGQPFAEPVTMWWNFVGHDRAAISQAQHDWENGAARFGPVGDGSAPRLSAPPLPWA
ncbi:pirin family protein [Chitinilyticum litopenaei]|uniref:pirin family protein n=1 Tax=Chitinilyticum litopenaei TaxID=1121276 RepID=UPI000411E802|nr:pirin family protein [Chitinilyticum litopenaei]